ncbi:MAG: tyrosine-type recombinase/integrase [Rhodospirillaceae bacterium]|nr:tyrosine-type recombinase/integrase [Rhodospirillaceae bacterium]MYH38150.1 tyrosine-type recombinase/integrase [Rhodospirillaceae bacterium]MYK58638.1 tyrosine-type recombinase/integrase [Rhodospirillaceae bacterium]
MTERARLTDALALAARPREREYAVHDTALQGFMLRIQPDGARSWVFRFRRDGTPRRVTLGKPEAVKADQARAAALAFLAREKGGGQPLPLPASGPTLTKFASEYMERRSPSWKPSTVETTRNYLNGVILPVIGHLRVGSVVRADIARFFHEYGRRKPGGANRSHEILRNMFDCAVAWGHRPEAAGNPCRGIVRYRRPPRGRLLGADDLAKLGTALRERDTASPVCVAAVRLILMTGCRPGEIRRLRWCEVKPDRLTLIDAKTGPRHVLLGEAARELLDSLAETASGEWVFPGKSGDEPLGENDLYWFWIKTRDAAGIVADARLHDLRHSHASHAVMNGESLHVAGRLLGHRRASTTNRYVHLDDATLGGAAERVALAVQQKLCRGGAGIRSAAGRGHRRRAGPRGCELRSCLVSSPGAA